MKKNTEEGAEKALMKIYKNKKNIVNKARKRLREEHGRKVMMELEGLSKMYT